MDMTRRSRFSGRTAVVASAGASIALLSGPTAQASSGQATPTTSPPLENWLSNAQHAPTTSVPESSTPESDPVVSALAAQYRVDETTARKIELRQAEATAEVDSLARLAGDFWAGAWMDEVDGTTMVVGVTSGDAAKAVALAAPDWVVVKRVDRTIVELGELQDELRTVLFEAVAKRVQELPEDQASIERAGNPANQWYAKVDVVNNRIVVALREGSLLAEEAGRLAPFDQPAVDLRVVQTELGTTESTCPADNCWMLGSGAFLEGNGVCTAGFTYWRGGVPWSSTAEHCGGPYQHSGGRRRRDRPSSEQCQCRRRADHNQ